MSWSKRQFDTYNLMHAYLRKIIISVTIQLFRNIVCSSVIANFNGHESRASFKSKSQVFIVNPRICTAQYT